MVSRRNFLSITIIMLTLLLMFQLTQVYYENIAEVDENAYIPEQVISGTDAWEPEEPDPARPVPETRYILYVGDETGEIGNAVRQWCTYTKRNLVTCRNIDEFTGEPGDILEYLLVESGNLILPKDLNTLDKFGNAGVDIIFCDLPDVNVISGSTRLQNLLGIRTVAETSIQAEGIRLFSGFLLGGEASYLGEKEEDGLTKEELKMPWYQLSAGAQTYMVGILDEMSREDPSITREMYPALLWSYSNGKNTVFAVNGDYLQGNAGVGILAAIDARLSDYALYPVLDAQVLTVSNYPSLADENQRMMQKLFSSGMIQAGRDVVFPQLVATARQAEFQLSCMLQVQYDYMDAAEPGEDALSTYLQLMKKAEAEIGLSLDRKEDIAMRGKLREDVRFLETAGSKYHYGAVFSWGDPVEDILSCDYLPENVNTVVSARTEDTDLISFGNDDITVQTITNDAADHGFRSDLYMRSVQTALGYTNVLMDMNRVFWPTAADPSWEVLSKRYADNLYTYWRPFQAFEDVTVSGSDQKIRNLLAMDYSHVRKNDVIYLDLEDQDQGTSFLLRLQNSVPEYISGADCLELEEGIYLIRTTGPTVEIYVKDRNPVGN